MRDVRLLVVVAHPDDETFGCGAVLLHAAAVGMETAVCCATRGEAGEPAPGSGVRQDELGRVREQELRAAADLMGVGRLVLLDYADSGMSGRAGAETLVGAPFANVVADVRAVIDDLKPAVLVTLDAGDGHRDHVRIRDATVAAADTATHRVERRYLWCLPRVLMQQWVDHMAAADPSRELPQEIVEIGTPDELITTVLDAGPYLEQRERAMAAHASQVSPYDGLPPELRKAFLGTAHLQRLVPEWTGGARESDIFPA